MAHARKNFRPMADRSHLPATERSGVPVDPRLDLGPDDIFRGSKQYEDWHWGLPPLRVIDWNDPDMPNVLIECGRLVRLHIRAPKRTKHPRRDRDAMIQFAQSVSNRSHIAYDPEHPDERLYLLVAPEARTALRQRFWVDNAVAPMDLNHVAAVAGGRHGKRRDYPDIPVKPMGILTAVVYQTHKKGDEPGPSYYIHRMAEISHIHPVLTIDAQGRMWLAGGNYRTPVPGITD